MIVVVTTGGNTGQLTPLVRAAVRGDQPLPPNEAGNAQLRDAIVAATRPPAARPTLALPATAAGISGRVYQFPINPSRIDSLALFFAKDGTATVELVYYGAPLRIPIGWMASIASVRTAPMAWRQAPRARGARKRSSCST